MARKKARSAKQKANDKRLGKMAKQKARGRKQLARTRKMPITKQDRLVQAAGRLRKTNKGKTKRKSVKRNSVKSVLGSSTLKKVALGLGGATLATAMISFIAPNSSLGKFAPAAGAYALGGLEGIIGQFALGMLKPRTTNNQNVVPAMEVL